MANYYGNTRTNYFRVIDEVKFESIVDSICACEDTVEYWTQEKNGETYYAFGVNDSIAGICECPACNSCEGCENKDLEGNGECQSCECESEYSYSKMVNELQKVLHPEDAIIIVEAGYEKLRYVGGNTTIITSTGVEYKDIWNDAINKAKEMLNNDEYSTDCTY